jgi:hypothetical protein
VQVLPPLRLARRPGGGAPGSACALVVSDTSPADAPHAVYLFRRWLPLIFAIKRAPRMTDPSVRMPVEMARMDTARCLLVLRDLPAIVPG